MASLDVVEPAVVPLGDDRREGVVPDADLGIPADDPTHDSVGDAGQVERVGEGDRVFKKAGLFHPGESRHLAGPVQHKGSRWDFLVPDILARDDHGDARAHWALTWHELAFSPDQGRVADANAGHVSDGVEFPGGIDAEVQSEAPRTHARLVPWR